MSDRAKPTKFSKELAATIEEHPELLQEDLAKTAGVTQGTISNYKTGASFPSKTGAQAMSDFLGVDLMPSWQEVEDERKKESQERRKQGRLTRKRQAHLADRVHISLTEEEIHKRIREYGLQGQEELLNLLDALKSLPPEERIKRFVEWRTQGNLQIETQPRRRRAEVRLEKAGNSADLQRKLGAAKSVAAKVKKIKEK